MARESLNQLRERHEAERLLAATLGKKLEPKKRSRPSVPSSKWGGADGALARVDARLASGDWEDVTAAEWVALYAKWHVRIYGVDSAELESSKTRGLAAIMARKLREAEFPDDPSFAAYVRWVCGVREQSRERWRRENGGGNGGHLSWRHLFGRTVLDEYRREQVRKAAKR